MSKPSKWISVVDRLPDDQSRVIVLIPFGLRVRDDTYTVENGWLNSRSFVSHWQPIDSPGTGNEIARQTKDFLYPHEREPSPQEN